MRTLSLPAALLALVPLLAQDATPRPRLLVADASKRRIAIVEPDGKLSWEYKTTDLHDLHMLPSGNVLFQTSWTKIVEVDPKTNKVVWEYDSAVRNGNSGKRIEVHAFQRLPNDMTMIAESGASRIIEVDSEGRLISKVQLRVDRPDAHKDTRLVRKLESGNYLVCHEGMGLMREYDPTGEIAWEYKVPLFDKAPKGGHGVDAWGNAVYSAVRLKNGNTLIGTGNGHSVLEVTPKGEIAWHLKQNDLPGIQLAWVTTVQELPSGNIVVGNCHAGPKNPQVIEVTRDKKVVWQYNDFTHFGDSTTCSQVLDLKGDTRR